ncbi:GerMN domain-containing protein [Fodinibius sp.]|uniref:GerMN domain-containing protein n=1 Tax=Fodinibius sp. TaxID=1872440 RepID=UPI002ACE49A6|nr:GerMN domain-containing protein [Fodinibius sp.]MDZ7660318.1 GerMN domain-containing protein [Fodinibius sp.]
MSQDTETPVNGVNDSEEQADNVVDNDSDDPEDEDESLPDSVDVFLVDVEAAEEGEGIGCGDEMVAISRDIEPTAGVLMAALTELFSITEDEYEGYYNALENSDLGVESASVEDGVATVYIEGEVSVGGVCDEPRFEEQIRQTVLQFSTVESARIFVNGTPLGEIFDSQGSN